MRKIVSILLFVAIATVLAVGSASAAVTNTAHDMTLIKTDVGTCSACHIPHKTMGNKRLWAVPMGGGTGDGTVGNLCAACHAVVAGGYSLSTVEAALAYPYVFPSSPSSLAHGLDSNWATSSTGQNGGAGDELPGLTTALPYLKVGTANGDPEDSQASNNLIQCTSCHNVHDNAFRPFLRRNIRDLCITCHLGRAGGGTADTGGDAAVIPATWAGQWGYSNYGSHPVGPDVDATSQLGRDEIITFTAEWFNFFEGNGAGAGGRIDGATAPSDASGRWNLGRHAVTSTVGANGLPGDGKAGGVVCVSCHAIHGYQDDATASGSTAPNMVPVGNLLGIEQTQGSTGGGVMLAFNGATDAANFLCESCHHVSNGASAWASASAWAAGGGTPNFVQNNNTAYTGSYYPNPGATAYTHPIDDAVKISVTSLVTSFNGGLWPSGGGTATDYPLCESCHVPHPLRDGIGKTGRTDINSGATSFILRDDLEEICNGCHGSGTTVPDHHPTGVMAAFTGVTPGSGRLGNGATHRTSGWVAGNGRIGNSDAILTCGDCHNAGSAGGAVHNWDDALSGIALDPDWDADSESCEKCHYRIRAGSLNNANLTPTHIRGQDWGTADHAATPNPDGNSGAQYDKGSAIADAVGTHFLGNVTTNFGWSNGQDGVNGQFNASTTVWPTNIAGATGLGRSIFGSRLADDTAASGAAHFICESCHELEPTKNNSYKLLFADYAEGATVPDVADSFFCEGCHGHNPGMEFASDTSQAKSHPLTGDTVSRTGNPVNQASFPTIGQASYPATATRLTCDSCHQVHDAATNSATYILDGADSTATLNSGASLQSGRGGSVTAPHVEHPRGVYVSTSTSFTGAGLNYDGFCQQCHAY